MGKSGYTELEGERALDCCQGMAYKDSRGQKSGVFGLLAVMSFRSSSRRA